MIQEPPFTEIPTATDISAVQEAIAQQPNITLFDLIALTKFLSNLHDIRRLSDFEIAGIKPHYDALVAFIEYQEKALAQQSSELSNSSSNPQE